MLLIEEIKWFFIYKKLNQIKLIFLDVDGVLTNGELIYDDKGNISKCFNVRDGLGIRLLQDFGIEIVIVSGGFGGSIDSRSKDLGIKYCYTRIKDKSQVIEEFKNLFGYQSSEILFLGDDINDLVVKDKVGLLITPKDGSIVLKRKSNAVLSTKGGKGAVRELAERILKWRQGWEELSKKGWKDLN
tara:strand:- start:8 stop:565 length:558 start_codon:yes stop_codon:yes gene_type:complete